MVLFFISIVQDCGRFRVFVVRAELNRFSDTVVTLLINPTLGIFELVNTNACLAFLGRVPVIVFTGPLSQSKSINWIPANCDKWRTAIN